MYDPARDIFTSSEDAPVDPDQASTERNADAEPQLQAGEFVQDIAKPSIDLKEKGETPPAFGSTVSSRSF